LNKEFLKKIKLILPKFPSIQGKEEYFNSAVLVLLTLIDREYHFVFQKRKNDIRQGSEICFPGGGYDFQKDKNFKNTAIRETIEELGVSKSNIDIIGQLDTVVAPMGATIDTFLAILKVDSLSKLNINRDEIEKLFHIPISYFLKNKPEEYSVLLKIFPSYKNKTGEEIILFPSKQLNLPEIYHKPWGNKKYKVFVYKINGEIIWGITARLIYDLVLRISKNKDVEELFWTL